MKAELKTLLRRGIERLGIEHTADQLTTLGRYVDELERWNPKYKMVKAAGRELVVRHVLDCLAALPWLRDNPHGPRMADIGSGAGLPGMPLAIFLESCRITLVERSARRAGFLRNAVVLLELRNVEVLQKDLREIPKLRGTAERFDVVLFRAFAPLAGKIEELRRAAAPGGLIIAYKGREERVHREIADLEAHLKAAHLAPPPAPPHPRAGVSPKARPDVPRAGSPPRLRVVRLEVPFLEEERHLVVLQMGAR